MTWQGVCAICGEPVKGGSANGTLDVPVGGQKVICLSCIGLHIEEPEEGDES